MPNLKHNKDPFKTLIFPLGYQEPALLAFRIVEKGKKGR